jgi:hypothetical protein
MSMENYTTTQTTSFITDTTLYNNNSQQNGNRFCSFRRCDGAIRTTIMPGFGDQNDKELEENRGYTSEDMCLLMDEGQPKLGKPEDDTYVAIVPTILMDHTCRKRQESSLAATDFSSMCMEVLARSRRTYG